MRGLLMMLAAVVTACSAGPERRGEARSIETGATPGRPQSVPLRTVVRDAGGRPLRGAQVAWRVTAGGGAISPRTGVTDSAGHAAARWTLVSDTLVNRAEATARVGERWEVTIFSIPARGSDTDALSAADAR